MTTEDLQRKPDGIPHAVVGLTALFCVMLAMLIIAVMLTGATAGGIAAVVVGLVTAPVLGSRLLRKARKDRDHVHPST